MKLLADITIHTGWVHLSPNAVTVLVIGGVGIWGTFVIHNAVNHGYGFWKSTFWFLGDVAPSIVKAIKGIDPAIAPEVDAADDVLQRLLVVLERVEAQLPTPPGDPNKTGTK